MPKQDKKKTNKKKLPFYIRYTFLCMLILSIVSAGFFYLEMYRLEQGALDVCAVQQDAYVQLVLDQINLKENRNDEEIIDGILGTLDASSNRYWVFSKDKDMLFVKDVLETNRYKGFTKETYYSSQSAQSFLEKLQMNRVIHDSIVVGEKTYIASGVSFSYVNNTYNLVLLTNKDIMLENNAFLRSRSEVWIVVFVVLTMLIAIPSMMSWRIKKENVELQANKDEIESLSKRFVSLNDRLANRDIHDNVRECWKSTMLPMFLERLKTRNDYPITILEIDFDDQEEKNHFLTMAKSYLTQDILRFHKSGGGVNLLFVSMDAEKAQSMIKVILDKHGRLTAGYTAKTKEELEQLLIRYKS